MQRIKEFARQTAERINRRIAVGLVVIAAAGGVFWQGTRWLGAKPPVAVPAKQVATGVAPPQQTGDVAPAAASLSDDPHTAAQPGGNNLGAEYAQFLSPSSPPPAADASPRPPPTSSYLPASSDPTGGYGQNASPRSAYVPGDSSISPFAAATQTPAGTDVPPSTAASPPPENPYRRDPPAADGHANSSVNGPASGGGESIAYPPLSHSPYAAVAGNSPGDHSEATQPQSAPPPGMAPTLAPPPTTYEASPSTATPSPEVLQSAADPVALSPNALPPTSPSTSPPNSLPTRPVESPYAPAASLTATNPYLPGAASQTMPPAAGRLTAAPTPGERHLEGPQQPSLTLEKVSPSEIQIGKPAKFELFVRNAGQAAARDVVVTDHVPAGTQLQAARPEPQRAADGSLVWNLGTLQPGEESQITLDVLPQSEGEIGSTAQVTFAAAATSRSICTRPQLTIEQSAPPKVLIGESLAVAITVSNPGTGPATGVIIDEDVPDGLSHVAGAQLEYDIGTLRPGESKRLELSLRAEKAGSVQNTIRVRGDANLAATHAAQIEVVAPQLQVGVEGPKLRFVERQATYTVQVANAGTAAARDIELAAFLPRGLKFVSTDSQGQYDPAQHAVFWSLAELPPAAQGAARLTTLPIEPGEQKLKVQASAALNLSAVGEQVVQVEQVAELLHTVKDIDDVIEVGSETTYEIRVTNQGTKAATNVRVVAAMPPGMAALSGDGPTRAAGDATQITFEPLAALRPQEEVVWRIQAKGLAAGDQIVRVQLASDESPTPVTREKSTRVYQDR